MAAIMILNNANITAIMINALDSILSLVLSARATGVTVISMHNIHADEN